MIEQFIVICTSKNQLSQQKLELCGGSDASLSLNDTFSQNYARSHTSPTIEPALPLQHLHMPHNDVLRCGNTFAFIYKNATGWPL